MFKPERLFIAGLIILILAQLAIGVTAYAQKNIPGDFLTESTTTSVSEKSTATPAPTTAILDIPTAVIDSITATEVPQIASDVIFFSDRVIYKLSLGISETMATPPSRLSQASIGTGPIFVAPNGQSLAIAEGVDIGWFIYIVNADTGESRPLFPENPRPGFLFGWLPDSRHVLFWTDRGPGKTGLLVVDTQNGKTRQVTDTENSAINGQVDGVAASPDGKHILFATWAGFGAPGKMWSIDIDGSNLQLLFKSEYPSYGLTWSPDGNWIAYIGDDGQGGYGLCIMRPDGMERRLLSKNFSEGFGFLPVWSPDSQKIAFVARELPLEKPQDLFVDWDLWALKGNNIHLVSIETGEERRLLPDTEEGNIDPAWSPDGSTIAFVSNRSGSPEVWLISADGTGLQQLTNDGKVKRTVLWLSRP